MPKSNKRDMHHLLYPKHKWNDIEITKQLRAYWYLRVAIPTDSLHADIHRTVSEIPVPSHTIAKEVLAQLKLIDGCGALSEDDPITKRLTLLFSLFEGAAPSTAKAIKAQLQVALNNKKPP